MSEETQQSAPKDVNAGVQPTPLNPIDRAEQAAQRIEAANKKGEEIARRMEDAAARMMLSGTAGGNVEAQPKVETAAEYAKRALQNKI